MFCADGASVCVTVVVVDILVAIVVFSRSVGGRLPPFYVWSVRGISCDCDESFKKASASFRDRQSTWR